MTWIDGFLQHHRNAAVSDEIWAGIPAYPNICHCGKVNRQIAQCSGKVMRNFGRLIYPAVAAVLHDPLPRHQAVFQRTLTCVRSAVYWSLVLQYRTHTTKTLNYLADYSQEMHATKDIFTTYRTSNATDHITDAHNKDLKMQLQAEHTIEDEDRPECGDAVSHPQKRHL